MAYNIPIPGPGRDHLCTPEKIAEICGHLEDGSPIEDACALSGIAESTYYEWMGRAANGEHPFVTFSEEVRRARAKARKYFIEVLKTSTLDKSFQWQPAAWFLERTDRKNFGRHEPVEKNVTISGDEILKLHKERQGDL